MCVKKILSNNEVSKTESNFKFVNFKKNFIQIILNNFEGNVIGIIFL